jgi:hypothetical protein
MDNFESQESVPFPPIGGFDRVSPIASPSTRVAPPSITIPSSLSPVPSSKSPDPIALPVRTAPSAPHSPGESKFRASAKKFFLTYPQSGEIDLHKFQSAFITKFQPEICIVAHEPHKAGGFHFHVFCEWPERKNVRNPRYFDLLGLHPNVQTCRNKKNTILYIIKDGKYILHGINEGEINAFRSGLNEFVGFLKTQPSKAEIISKFPAYCFRYPRQIESFLTYVKEMKDEEARSSFVWPANDSSRFTEVELELLSCMWRAAHGKRRPRSHNIYLWGATQCGKSLFVDCLSKYFSVYNAPTDESFFDLYSDQDFVCFDEYRSTHSITWLNTFTGGYTMSIRKKGTQGLKKKNPLSIVLANVDIYDQYPNVHAQHPMLWNAFSARFRVFHVTRDPQEPGDVDIISFCNKVFPHCQAEYDEDLDRDNPYKN